jgi:hypothetical protein
VRPRSAISERVSDGLGPIPAESADDKDTDPHLFQGVPEQEEITAPRCFFCGRTSQEYDTAQDVRRAFDAGIRHALDRFCAWAVRRGLPGSQVAAIRAAVEAVT